MASVRAKAAVLAVGGLAVAVAVALAAASRSRSPPPGEDVAPPAGSGNDVARQTETTGASVDASASASASATASAPKLATAMTAGNLEVVALFDGAAPAGVTVSTLHRIFVAFPRRDADAPFTVAELHDGKAVPYPDADTNRIPSAAARDKGFVSVQSVVVDPIDRLWILDSGAVARGATELGGPKLVGIDLGTDSVFATIILPRDVAFATSYLEDVRFDLSRGRGGIAYITDSSATGPNGIIVVDLDSQKSWRRLNDHPSTKADRSFRPVVEGRVLEQRDPGRRGLRPPTIGADGIALSSNGDELYYSPLASRHLYSVSTKALAYPDTSEADVARTVKDLGEKGASDGLESDSEGRLYVTSYEANAILRRRTNGSFETLVADPRVLWPDSLSLGRDGFLYFTVNQREREPQFHDGHDLRQKPYVLFRIPIDASPLLLAK